MDIMLCVLVSRQVHVVPALKEPMMTELNVLTASHVLSSHRRWILAMDMVTQTRSPANAMLTLTVSAPTVSRVIVTQTLS